MKLVINDVVDIKGKKWGIIGSGAQSWHRAWDFLLSFSMPRVARADGAVDDGVAVSVCVVDVDQC